MYSNYIKRCDEADRRLRFFESEMKRFKIQTIDGTQQLINESLVKLMEGRKNPANTFIEDVEK